MLDKLLVEEGSQPCIRSYSLSSLSSCCCYCYCFYAAARGGRGSASPPPSPPNACVSDGGSGCATNCRGRRSSLCGCMWPLPNRRAPISCLQQEGDVAAATATASGPCFDTLADHRQILVLAANGSFLPNANSLKQHGSKYRKLCELATPASKQQRIPTHTLRSDASLNSIIERCRRQF